MSDFQAKYYTGSRVSADDGHCHAMVEPGDCTRYEFSAVKLPTGSERDLGRYLFRMGIGDDIQASFFWGNFNIDYFWILEHFKKALGGCAEYNARVMAWFIKNLAPGMLREGADATLSTEELGKLFREQVRGL
jgi:hypothetical protein